jgi:hypothetical protein
MKEIIVKNKINFIFFFNKNEFITYLHVKQLRVQKSN